MNLSFAALYGLSVLSLFGLAILTGYLFEHGRSAWRRWRCHREMQKRPVRKGDLRFNKDLYAFTRVDFVSDDTSTINAVRRRQLEALATARDKAERKIPLND